MIGTNQFKNGVTIIIDGKIYQIIGFQHIKPGKGGAFVRTKLRNLQNAAVIDKTFRAGEKFESAYIEQRKVQFLYHSGDTYFFMDTQSYDQLSIDKTLLKDAVNFLKEGTEIQAAYYGEKPIGVTLPASIALKITHTDPGIKTATAKATNKPATLETGAMVQVPVFIKNNEVIKIDTRTGKYLGRA